jgi:hypothetical protein
MITGDSPWISSIHYIDEEHWKNDFNDKLYLQNSRSASWSHLQVRKADVLREFSALIELTPETKSSSNLPPMQIDVLEIARKLWPTGKTPPRIKERNQAIQAEFGKNPPSERTIRRALKDWP